LKLQFHKLHLNVAFKFIFRLYNKTAMDNVDDAMDGEGALAAVRPHRRYSPRHRMPFNSITEGSKYVR